MSASAEMAVPREASFRRRSPVRFWFGVAGAVIALAVTGYLGAMTVLWRLHIENLRADETKLALLEAERSAVLADQEEELEELHAALLRDLRAVTDGAHDKALYEDLRRLRRLRVRPEGLRGRAGRGRRRRPGSLPLRHLDRAPVRRRGCGLLQRAEGVMGRGPGRGGVVTPRSARRALAAAAASLVLTACSALPVAPSALPEEWVPSISPSPLPSEQADSPLGYTLGSKPPSDPKRHVRRPRHGERLHPRRAHDRHEPSRRRECLATRGDPLGWNRRFRHGFHLRDQRGRRVHHDVRVPRSRGHPRRPSATRDDSITVVGYPDGDVLVVSSGTIETLESDTLDNASFVFSTTAEAAPGSSGSAVYNDDGEVMGVLYAGNEEGGVTLRHSGRASLGLPQQPRAPGGEPRRLRAGLALAARGG